MKFIISLFFLITMSLDAVAQEKSLSCSKNGTVLFYINGINVGKTDFDEDLDRLFETIVSLETKFDNQGSVSVTGEHNSSEGFTLDYIQLVRQKLEGQKKYSNSDIVELISLYFHSRIEFIRSIGEEIYDEIRRDMFLELNSGETISQNDIKVMAIKIRNFLNQNKKVIVVSHSQGNIYANYVYDELLNIGVPAEALNKYYGNLQVGSAARSLKAKNAKVYSLKDDIALNWLSGTSPRPVLDQKYRVSLHTPSSLYCVLNYCHGFASTYQSSSMEVVGPKQGASGEVTRKSVDVFRENLEEVAWMLANNDDNCCDGREGRFYRKDYSSPASGFVENTVDIASRANITISESAQLCGELKIRNPINYNSNIYIRGNSEIHANYPILIYGNIDFLNSVITNYTHQSGAEFNGGNEYGLKFANSLIHGGGKISGDMWGNSLEVSGAPEITANSFFNINTNEMLYPSLDRVELKGEDTELKGFFYLGNLVLDDSIIEGEVEEPTPTSNRWTFLAVDGYQSGSSSFGHIYKNVHFKGVGYLTGPIGENVRIEGFTVGNNNSGVVITNDSSVLNDSSLRGSLVLQYGTSFSGNWVNETSEFGSIGIASTIRNATVNGRVEINNSIINGGSYSSVGIHYPFAYMSNLTNCNASCNSYIRDETATNKTFGCGYISEGYEKEKSKWRHQESAYYDNRMDDYLVGYARFKSIMKNEQEN